MARHRLELFLHNLGWPFKQISPYDQALTHSSYAYEFNRNRGHHNERLEFLGDAVLELVISDFLFRRYPNYPEGKLTRLRADIVCESTLAYLAEKINLGSFLLLGKGELAGEGNKRPSLLADALEALIGALFVDLGYKKAYPLIIRMFRPVFREMENGFLRFDYKTVIQEFTQSRCGVTPEYRIVAETGPDHDKIFEAQLFIGEQVWGCGQGRSKKEAEQNAAKKAWETIGRGETGKIGRKKELF